MRETRKFPPPRRPHWGQILKCTNEGPPSRGNPSQICLFLAMQLPNLGRLNQTAPLLFRGPSLAITPLEALNSSSGIDELLLTRVKRMAFAAELYVEFRLSRFGHKSVATRAVDVRDHVIWVNFRLHSSIILATSDGLTFNDPAKFHLSTYSSSCWAPETWRSPAGTLHLISSSAPCLSTVPDSVPSSRRCSMRLAPFAASTPVKVGPCQIEAPHA